MKTEVAVLALLAAIAACAPSTSQSPNGPPVVAQDTVAQDTILKPATLLRRLAEAADGYRDGNLRYVVAAREFPHKVAGVFLDPDSARAVARDSSTGTFHYEVFGPYRTAPDIDVSTEVNDVDSVVAYYGDGKKTTYDGRIYDALFWSLPAFDKFVAPYLTFVAGALEAGRQREAYRRGDLTQSALAHKRGSL